MTKNPSAGVRLLLALLGLGAALLPLRAQSVPVQPGGPSAASDPGPADAADQQNREWFTDLPLVAQDGRRVRFYSDLMQGKVVLISGFYVDCETISPRQNTVLSQLQNLLGDLLGTEVFLVSITVDPKNDTPERVAEYAGVWKARPGWDFLTGKPENVDWVNHKLGQYVEDPESEHEGTYRLGNLRTGLWLKVPPQAGAQILRARLQQLLEDRPGKAVP